jgi:glycine cleavage system H lipoate-binding protein
MTTDFLAIYQAKLAEYLVAITYLLLFVPMWRYVQGGRRTAEATAAAHAGVRREAAQAAALLMPRPAGATAPTGEGWFQLPAEVLLHPGHTWARVEPDGLVTVGLDEFAKKLVAPEKLVLPRPGSAVLQGEPALEVGADGKTVPMLSPVDGTVVQVNERAREHPETLSDPYGAGWLFKVSAPRLAANRRALFAEDAARHYLEDAAEALALQVSPELGHVLQDGGTPVDGVGRALAGERWDEVARYFFQTERSEP